ncbi:PREDICTED: putative F-box protein At3g51171 [Camelina sativa]|uniref:F-box protein At3g51171 n=1 Tax=Camelina sativa TaxID=90675 RepID=A0ABM0WAR0_CAMSA|nr:PREDICTED: putative F-box protein At3g51171 [Camelina sativa]
MALLPRELEEEILSRLPPQSLLQLISVCKRWNVLLSEKSFIKNHFARARPHFIFLSNSNIYSIEIIGLDGADSTIKLHELSSSGIPYRELNFNDFTISSCDGFLFCNSGIFPKGTAIWNPWLRQVKWVEHKDKGFWPCGVGYDNTRPEKVYKILGYILCPHHERAVIYDCASHTFKFIDTPDEDRPLTHVKRYGVPLNGNLYWLRFTLDGTGDIFIGCFDFSREILKPLCLAPCQIFDTFNINHLVLQAFNENRLSLLKRCNKTRNVEIWVTKKKIDASNNSEDEKVVWINLLTLPPTNFPDLSNKDFGVNYFLYDKTTLIMCCGDNETGWLCIYIFRADLFKKFQIDLGFNRCCHCVYAPNFIPIPLEFGSTDFITFC